MTEHVQVCRDAVGPARAPRLDGYEATYAPLGFRCHVAGGGTFTGGVPAYANPAALALAATAAVLAGAAALASRHWAARTAPAARA
ncbi:hypothetical protein [Streptomyces sp. G45]|uniref:hypothetical protein n=1 Tax=Streptomyces sp. G45 TaxID=3406627 RepID=UPI003C1EA5CE